jgi:predicted choloylglycine hydrolase
VWSRDEGPVLVRNYDYAPSRIEGVIWSTRLTGRRVIGMSDCLWGLLDGMNDAGLAVSLTFGGRRVLGDGFGIPIVVRYLLEVCDDVASAREVLARLPFALAHNLTVIDRAGDVLTAYLSPDREPIFRAFPVATNHQGIVEWPEQARATRTIERERCILHLLQDPDTTRASFEVAFLRAPLFSTSYESGFGTLYTASYRPGEGVVDYRWPAFSWRLGFDAFEEAEHTEVPAEGSVA